MRMLRLAIVLAITVSAAACQRNETSSSPIPPVSAAGRETFAPTDTIYASVATDSASASTLSARWTFEDGQLVSETLETVAGGERAATEFHIAKPDG